MMQTQKDGYALMAGELAAAGTMGLIAYSQWSTALGFIALFGCGFMVGIAIAVYGIMYERMKWNRIFGRDMYTPPHPIKDTTK
jgi:hypothetical protein